MKQPYWSGAVRVAKLMADLIGCTVAVYDVGGHWAGGYIVRPLVSDRKVIPMGTRPHLGRDERLLVGRIGKEMCTW